MGGVRVTSLVEPEEEGYARNVVCNAAQSKKAEKSVIQKVFKYDIMYIRCIHVMHFQTFPQCPSSCMHSCVTAVETVKASLSWPFVSSPWDLIYRPKVDLFFHMWLKAKLQACAAHAEARLAEAFTPSALQAFIPD